MLKLSSVIPAPCWQSLCKGTFDFVFTEGSERCWSCWHRRGAETHRQGQMDPAVSHDGTAPSDRRWEREKQLHGVTICQSPHPCQHSTEQDSPLSCSSPHCPQVGCSGEEPGRVLAWSLDGDSSGWWEMLLPALICSAGSSPSFNQRKLPQKAWGDVQKVI